MAMKIRSITLFTRLELPLDAANLTRLAEAARVAKRAFEDAGYTVQTTRLATDLFPALLTRSTPAGIVSTVVDVETHCRDAGFDFVAIGTAGPKSWPWVSEILAATDSIFVTSHLVEPGSGRIEGQALRYAARIIKAAAQIAEGFGNLRFAALANVAAGTPFFPSAYWTAEAPAFAIATQAADLALEACLTAPDLAQAHAGLRNKVTAHGQALARTGEIIARDQSLDFLGIDFSPAPYPDPDPSRPVNSIGAAIEALTGAPLGAAGTLAAAATLTDAIQQASFPHVGFCGLMMPVLEDSILALRAAEGRLSIGELLQWSAVCGTGLDTVPIPGDASEDAIAALLYDVATLAVRLNKPLTARLMPLPGKRAGDPVHFDFPYFADGGVLPMPGDGIPHPAESRLGRTEHHILSPILSRIRP
jgi:uncharacterized protein